MQTLFTYAGPVIHGHHRGKTLGFPTANLALPMPIPHGIYISTVELEKKSYLAATFIGPSETFGETESLSETHIIDFSQDIYGKKLSVTLNEYLRPSVKFSTVDALIQQMHQDIQAVRAYTFSE
jgi:riboflavin kinase/FMN adenylyltransferase